MEEATIFTQLTELAKSKDVTILYACETGSRAWGFPSPDSDYDVRMIYKHETNWYLSLSEKKDTIETMLMDRDLDITGWDIRKCLRLLWKSNGALLERLQSPIVYHEAPGFLDLWRPAAEACFSPVATMYHYLRMGRNGFDELQGQPEVKLKKLFYALRAALACEWIRTRNSIPPIVFQTLLEELEMDSNLRSYVKELIVIKAEKAESYLHPANPELIRFIATCYEKAGEIASSLKGSASKEADLDNIFLELLTRY